MATERHQAIPATADAWADVYTVPAAKKATIMATSIANRHTAGVEVSVRLTDASDSDSAVEVLDGHPLPDGQTMETLAVGQVLAAGDKLQARSTVASGVGVVVTVDVV